MDNLEQLIDTLLMEIESPRNQAKRRYYIVVHNILNILLWNRDERSESAKRFFRDARSKAEGRSALFRERKESIKSLRILCVLCAFAVKNCSLSCKPLHPKRETSTSR